MNKKRILFVVTSHAELGSTGRLTGAYLPEVAHPYDVLTKAGFEIDFVSPKGGRVPLDGVDLKDPVNAAFLDNAEATARLHASKLPSDVDPSSYAAVFFAGGHGTMWDFPDNERLAEIAAAVYEGGGVVAAVCHGPAGLVNVRLKDGSYLVAGKAVAAFTNDEERGTKLEEVVPFLLVDKLTERGARVKLGPDWKPNVVVSERLVTGQNPASAHGVGQAIAKLVEG